MTETKRVMCMTEWEVTMRNGARTVDIRTASVPDEVERVADEMRKPKRPEPLTVEEALGIWDHYFTCHGGISSVLQADRKRQAEIAAWDAEHGPKPEASDATVWVEAPKVYPEDGMYWYRTFTGSVGTDHGTGGQCVDSTITHISGPIQLKQPVDP